MIKISPLVYEMFQVLDAYKYYYIRTFDRSASQEFNYFSSETSVHTDGIEAAS
jgi:hypothetical protein